MFEKETSSASSSPGPGRKRPSQVARKSTGGQPPRSVLSPSPSTTEETPPTGGMPSHRRPIHAVGLLDADETKYSRAGSSDLSSSSTRTPRTSQSARKRTGGVAPRRQLDDESIETPTSPQIPPRLPIIPVQNSRPKGACGLCRMPLPTPCAVPNPSQLIHDFTTLCQHQFHYVCYINYITIAPPNGRACCPQCLADLLTNGRYWVHVTTNTGNQCYTDMTQEVEARLLAVRQARQQIFIDFMYSRNIPLAASLLTGPEAVDVNFRAPNGGFTVLHYCAMYNDVAGINLLLSHGADKFQKNDSGLLPIDCARMNNARDAEAQLATDQV
ncbi:hypothetical protein C8R44DRAFT_13583 [Mycena epipterygia]|nr:hypothetical protein C8R44DRAFT_13583 [Mycena epipterygia]